MYIKKNKNCQESRFFGKTALAIRWFLRYDKLILISVERIL